MKMQSFEPPRKRFKAKKSKNVRQSKEIDPVTSYDVFMSFVSFYSSKGKTRVDASKIVGKDCYLTWLRTRQTAAGFPADVYRRTVIAHLTGTKKRKPFPKEVEASLLETVRIKQVWPCFASVLDNKGKPITFGKLGFRPRGYHESTQGFSTPKLTSKYFKSPPEKTQALSFQEEQETFTNFEVYSGEEYVCHQRNVELEVYPGHIPHDELQMVKFFFDI